ncbi:hypothetical protein [Listeria ilorinensis]|uniref:hypothetical protein n=1 Tax=Listeria ilorinensis TaxID=2867439 RepID=UPI001EF6DD38|nr:hypothetical protein [Listeria ilorinensis]
MSGFLLWSFFYGVPLIMGLLGLGCWFALKYKPSKAWGVVLIVIGVMSFFSFIGILYLVAGIMLLNNKYWRDEKNVTQQVFE